MDSSSSLLEPVEEATREETATEETAESSTGSSSYKTIAEQISGYHIYLENAADPEIAPLLRKFNITETDIAACRTALEEVKQLDADQKREYGEKYAAYENIGVEFKEASRPYTDSVAIARIVFKNDREAYKALVLGGKRKSNIADWVQDAVIFYKNLLASPDMLAKMARYNRTEDMLKAEFKEVNDVADSLAAYARETGEALRSTELRDQKLESLRETIDELIEISRIALKDTPLLLKKLGL